MTLFIDPQGKIKNSGEGKIITVDDFWVACFEFKTPQNQRMRNYNYCSSHEDLRKYVQLFIMAYNQEIVEENAPDMDLSIDLIKEIAPDKWLGAAIYITVTAVDSKDGHFIRTITRWETK